MRPRQRWRLEGGHRALAFGRALPTRPLWLADDRSVPLDPEATDAETCPVLRIG
jgi:hypothetical protein